MLEEEGTLDLLASRGLVAPEQTVQQTYREERARQEQLELGLLGRVEDFYQKLKALNDMTTAAEEGRPSSGSGDRGGCHQPTIGRF